MYAGAPDSRLHGLQYHIHTKPTCTAKDAPLDWTDVKVQNPLDASPMQSIPLKIETLRLALLLSLEHPIASAAEVGHGDLHSTLAQSHEAGL